LHTFYEDKWNPSECPVATEVWERLVSLPLFPGMTSDEQNRVVFVVQDICQRFAKT
jgi:perosamine synthetase